MQETYNTFNGGLDKDVSPQLIEKAKYLDAKDITITDEGIYGSATQIQGSEFLSAIIAPSTYGATDFNDILWSNHLNPMGVARCRVRVGGSFLPGAIVWIGRSTAVDLGDLTITVPDLNGNVSVFECYLLTFSADSSSITSTIKLFEKFRTDKEYLEASVDYEVSVENDFDYVYFTNQIDPPFKVKCEPLAVSEQEASLIRTKNMAPPVPSVTYDSSGNVLAGSYSFAVRMISSQTNSYTKWSLPSIPVAIGRRDNLSGVTSFNGNVGISTNVTISLNNTFDPDSFADFDYYQIAVVKNTDGDGLSSTTVSYLEPVNKGAVSSAVFVYDGDEQESIEDVTDLTVDDAQIGSFKTITIKNNFLIGGNVSYQDLGLDNGTPSITSAVYQIDSIPTGGEFYNFNGTPHLNLYYFRDEVYRFGIIYHDEFGNWSAPRFLVDYRFPSIATEPLVNSVGDDINGLYLRLNGVQNHPSWAKGFAIVRADRIKDIEFQTPVIPTMAVQPLEAGTLYPQGGSPASADAQPPNSPLGTYIPKNYRRVVSSHILRGDIHCQYYYGYDSVVDQQSPLSTIAASTDPEDRRSSISPGSQYVHVLFPPNNIYNSALSNYEPFSFKGGEFMEIIDIQSLLFNNPVHTETIIGDRVYNTSDYGASYIGQYSKGSGWYVSGNAAPDLQAESYIPQENKILEYVEVPSGLDRQVLSSKVPSAQSATFGDYSGLVAEGLNEGTPANNQKMAVVVLDQPFIDIQYKNISGAVNDVAFEDATGTTIWENPSFLTDVPARTDVTGGTFPPTRTDHITDNDPESFPTYMQIPIANVRNGLNDNRYGNDDEFHEYFFTGTYRSLTEAEVDGNTPIDVVVFGGDCSYDLHTFKISDTTYGLPDNNIDVSLFNQAGFQDLYGTSFWTGDYELGRPIPYFSDAQQISVLLESEVRAIFRDSNELRLFSALFGTIPTDTSAADARLPFIYSYNLDLSIPNGSGKIFVPDLALQGDRNFFRSRLQYSDQRTQTTRENGFDRFRVANIYDMDESRGDITRLVNSLDRVYSLQERGIAYIPVQAQVLESADAGNLAVRSAEVIGIPNYLSTVYGCQNFKSIGEGPYGFYFPDVRNKEVLFVSGNGIDVISSKGMKSFFIDEFDSWDLREKELVGVYDVGEQEYYLWRERVSYRASEPFMINYSNKTGTWISRFSTGPDYFFATSAGYLEGFVLAFGVFNYTSDGVSAANMLRGTEGVLLGYPVEPEITFSVNDGNAIPKVFDVFSVNSEGAIDVISVNTPTYGGQSTGMNIADNILREGTYRVPVLRDASGRRIRGDYANVTASWAPPVALQTYDPVELNSIITKFRISERKS